MRKVPRDYAAIVAATFPQNLKRIRIERGILQTELSSEMDVGATVVSKYETNQRVPSVANLVALAAKLDCTLNDLIPPESYRIKRGKRA